MGKGKNHHEWCTCGWCSGGYRGGHGHGGHWYGSAYREVPRELTNPVVPTHWAWRAVPEFSTFDSFTNPNAACPKCGAPVFFYRSPYNGRVFFDSLGPPWPKHPCMDNESDRLAVTGAVPLLHMKVPDGKSQWLHDGWRPFILTEYEHTNTPGTWRLRGAVSGMSKEFLIQTDRWEPASLVQVLRKSQGVFELSASVPKEDGNMHVMQVPAFETAPAAAAANVTLRIPGVGTQPYEIPSEVPATGSTKVPSAHSFKAVDHSLFRIGWRPIVVRDAVMHASLPHCWRIRGLWFGVLKDFHVHAPWWHAVTHLQARREDEHRFSLAALCTTGAGDVEVHVVDAFADVGRLEAARLTPALTQIRALEQRVRPVAGERPSLLLLVGGRAAEDALRGLGQRLKVRLWDLEEVFGDLFAGFELGNPNLHSEFQARAGALLDGQESPLLLHGLTALLDLRARLNPLFALMLLAAGRQIVALWPGSYSGGLLHYRTEGSPALHSYPAEGLVVHFVE